MHAPMPNSVSPAVRVASPEAAVPRFRPRALPALVMLAAIALCVVAGNWQQRRMHEKEALRAQFHTAMQAAPVDLAGLPAEVDWPALRFRSVVATGEYVARGQIFVDNKVVAGRAGFHVVTPLILVDGRRVLVNRGWIAQGASRSILPDALPPAGPVSVRGRIAIPSAGYLELKPETTTGNVWQNLDPARYGAATGLPVLPAIVEATSAPAPDDGLVRDGPAPDFGIETHRIYMVQWYAFALLAVVLWLGFNRPWPAGRNHGSSPDA